MMRGQEKGFVRNLPRPGSLLLLTSLICIAPGIEQETADTPRTLTPDAILFDFPTTEAFVAKELLARFSKLLKRYVGMLIRTWIEETIRGRIIVDRAQLVI